MECLVLAPHLLPLSSFPASKQAPRFAPPILPDRQSSRPRWCVGLSPTRCQKMYVPGFGEASPEAKAAKNLQDFFTYVAVRIVLSQLQSYNPEAYAELMEFIDQNSLNDGDKFCRKLMRESPRHQGLGRFALGKGIMEAKPNL